MLQGSGFSRQEAVSDEAAEAGAAATRAQEEDEEYLAELDVLQEGSDEEEPHRP